jgi:hypothetical protein
MSRRRTAKALTIVLLVLIADGCTTLRDTLGLLDRVLDL